MLGTVYLTLLLAGCFLVLIGVLLILLPKVVISWERKLRRKLRLLSESKALRPVKRGSIVLECVKGGLCLLIGIALIGQLPVQFSLCDDHTTSCDSSRSISPNHGTDKAYADLKADIDQRIQPILDAYKGIGISVGVIRQNERATFGYGKVRLNSARTPDGNTLYEIGSITKVFTALLLADMAEEGLIGLTDPIQKFLPSSVPSPRYDDREIVLMDFACHLSGLPRIPDNLYRLRDYASLAFVKNPYASYTVERLYAFLSQCTLPSKPGTTYQYSNLGMGLLGHLLATHQGTTYEDLVVSRICNPLDMMDTRITLSSEQQSRLAQGYGGVFAFRGLCMAFPAEHWNSPVLSGCGFLRSNVNDLMKFLCANMGTTETVLRSAIETIQKERHTINSTMSMAMGWHVTHYEEDGPILWHNGRTGGYRSYMGFSRHDQVGVVILSNFVSAKVDEAGVSILRALMDSKNNEQTIRTRMASQPVHAPQDVLPTQSAAHPVPC